MKYWQSQRTNTLFPLSSIRDKKKRIDIFIPISIRLYSTSLYNNSSGGGGGDDGSSKIMS